MRLRARSAGKIQVPEDKQLVLDHVALNGADFSGRRLVQFSAAGSRFSRCRFENVKIDSAAFGAGRDVSEFLDCTFDSSRIRPGPGGYARFVRCSFRDVELSDWICMAVEIVDCVFTGVVRDSIFNGSVPIEDRKQLRRSTNEFRGNDFSGSELFDVSFRTGVDLEAQRLPRGSEYLYLPRAAKAIQMARREIERIADAETRETALKVIRALEFEVEGGQNQLLLRTETYSPPLPREIVAALFDVLRASA